MFDSIEDAVSCWKENYSFIEDARLIDYRGGYPVVEFIIKEAAWDLVKDKKKFKRIVRNAEMEGGIEVGVATCFYDTASLSWEPPVMTICGYPEVIHRIIKKVF
jgi:hypothetical protein